mgnify:CR=1 FL=1
MDDEQGPKDLAEMLTKLAERKWTDDDFVQWWTYTQATFPGSVWANPKYKLIKQLGWCVVDYHHRLRVVQSMHAYLATNCAPAKLKGRRSLAQVIRTLGTQGLRLLLRATERRRDGGHAQQIVTVHLHPRKLFLWP